MTLAEAAAAPTIDDARRACLEVAAAGVCRVLLYGSVARGDAGPHSDIDLVAVFDDLNYSHRAGRQLALSAAAQASTGCRVQVHATDWPEWLHRTRRVSASFEAGIVAEAMVLYDRPPGDVSWDKEIGLASDNTREALGRLDEASKALNDLLGHTRMSELEHQSLIAADRAAVRHYRRWRLINVCQSAAMAIETSLRCLIALSGQPVRRRHDIDYLLCRTGDHAETVRQILAPLQTGLAAPGQDRSEDITVWRAAGDCLADHPEIDLTTTIRLAPGIAAAAVQLASLAVDLTTARVDNDARLRPVRRIVAAVAAALDDRDLVEGQPLGRVITPTERGPGLAGPARL